MSAAGKLAPERYFVRLRQGSKALLAKVVVL
jgi:hypothetical protein